MTYYDNKETKIRWEFLVPGDSVAVSGRTYRFDDPTTDTPCRYSDLGERVLVMGVTQEDKYNNRTTLLTSTGVVYVLWNKRKRNALR